MSVTKIDPRFDTVAPAIERIGNVVPGGSGSAAASGESVWIAPSSGLLSRLDPSTGRVSARSIPTPALRPSRWARCRVGHRHDANTVTRVDPTGLLTPIPVGHGPASVAVGAGGVWVADSLDDTVVRIDPNTRAVTTTIPVGRAPPARRRRRLGLGRQQRRRHRHPHRPRAGSRRRRSTSAAARRASSSLGTGSG